MSEQRTIAELRDIAVVIERNGGWGIAALKVRGAAAEIERLTAYVERLERGTAYKALEAERDRLRAALELIAEGTICAELFPTLDIEKDVWELRAKTALTVSRAVLEHQPAAQTDLADDEAIAAVPELKGKNAVVLYFNTPEDRDELVAAIHKAKPGMRAVNIR